MTSSDLKREAKRIIRNVKQVLVINGDEEDLLMWIIEDLRVFRNAAKEEDAKIANDHHHDMMCHDTHKNEVCAIAEKIRATQIPTKEKA